MKKVFLFLLTLIISSIYLPNGQRVLASSLVQNCPVDGNEIMCLENGGFLGFENCPAQNDVEYTLFGDGLLKCDSGKCCVKKDIQTCPPLSFCSNNNDLAGNGYRYAGITCVTSDGAPGKCWVVDTSYLFNTCIPYPDECDSPQCDSGKICKFIYGCSGDPNYPGHDNICWRCMEDDNGTCKPVQDKTCVTEETKDYRVCASDGVCPEGYKFWAHASCGSSSIVCCQKEEVLCGPPGLCFKGVCPDNYTYVSQCDNAADGSIRRCCKKIYVGDKPKPKDAAYNGPVIDSLEKILGPVVKILYYGGLMLGIFYIIISGYKLMVSQGNPQQTQDAQEQLTAAVVGTVFILLSLTILGILLTSIIGLSY